MTRDVPGSVDIVKYYTDRDRSFYPRVLLNSQVRREAQICEWPIIHVNRKSEKYIEEGEVYAVEPVGDLASPSSRDDTIEPSPDGRPGQKGLAVLVTDLEKPVFLIGLLACEIEGEHHASIFLLSPCPFVISGESTARRILGYLCK